MINTMKKHQGGSSVLFLLEEVKEALFEIGMHSRTWLVSEEWR